MNKTLYKVLNVGLAASFALTVGIAGSTATSSAKSSHKSLPTLRLVNWVAPNLKLAKTLDPAQISAAADYFVVQNVNMNLVANDTSGKILKQLAKKITVSKDRKTYTFTLRKAKFANGDNITASTVVYSIKRALSPDTASIVNYYDMDGYGDILGADAYANGKSSSLPGVKAINKSTVQIKITKKLAYFLYVLTYPINDVVDPNVTQGQVAKLSGNYLTANCPAARANASNQYTFKCVGNDFYPSGETPRYDLVPNPKYQGPFKKPTVNMELQVAGTSETAYNEYLSGALDLGGIPAAHLQEWRSNPRGQMYGGPSCPKAAKGQGCPTTTVFYITLNTKEPPFNNKACRLALAWGVNRKNLAAIFQGSEVPLTTITPNGLGIMNSKALKPILKKIPTTNSAKAQKYASQCPASAKSTQVQYIYATGDASGTAEALAVVQTMKDLGFTNAQAVGKSQDDWLTDVNTAMTQTHIQAVAGGWAQDYSDPQDYMTLLWACGSSYNIGEFCDKKADALMKKGDTAASAKARINYYNQAQIELLNQGYPIMTTNRVRFGLKKKYVHGLAYYVPTGVCPVHCDWSKVSISKH